MLSGSLVYASVYNQTDYKFNFTIKKNQGNTYSTRLYRGTTDRANSWMVNLVKSEESSTINTYTTFWLSDAGINRTPLSQDIYILSNGKPQLCLAENNKKEDVRLSAEDNNYNNAQYSCSGY